MHVILGISCPDGDEMRVLDVGKMLEMYDEVNIVNAIQIVNSYLFPGVYTFLNLHSIVTLISCEARSFGQRIQGDDVPGFIFCMTSSVNLLNQEIELFAVEFLVQCLRLGTKEVEFPECILCEWKIIVREGLIDQVKDPLRYSDLIQDQEYPWASFKYPIEICIVRQPIPKGQHLVQRVNMLLRPQVLLNVCLLDGSIYPLFRPPCSHSQPRATILCLANAMIAE